MTTLTESKKALIDKWQEKGIDPHLLQAFQDVPREAFIPEKLKDQAYLDQPLHIGHDQTISQPTTIMNMLQLLDASPKHKVLEIGAGSGYVCALLASMGCEVIGIEIVPELAVGSSKVLESLGFGDKVAIHAGDAGGGWEEDAPYNRILCSAAYAEVPHHLFDQLKVAGIMVAPVGSIEQRMLVMKKKKGGEIVEEDHGAYVFVPVTGKFGDGSEDLRMPLV